ncbi:MAG: ATP-binding protein [Myxococcaceae bacterium]|nr:ATP-binding protein [Myxococcaceae bacterium]
MTTSASCPVPAYTITRHGDLALASVPGKMDDCTLCRGTGLSLSIVVRDGKEYEVAHPCNRRTLEARLAKFNAANIPAALSHATFENFRPKDPEGDRARRTAQAFALGWPASRGFVLSGPVGTGKSHLLAAALRAVTLERGVSAAYVEISLLFQTIRRGFDQGKSSGEIIEPLAKVELLAIDEIGKGRGSVFELETLDELIARRYNAGRVTLFATNYSLVPPELRPARTGYSSSEDRKEAGRESRLLCDRVGDRIYSRLCELCDFVELPLDTPDHRRVSQAQRAR